MRTIAVVMLLGLLAGCQSGQGWEIRGRYANGQETLLTGCLDTLPVVTERPDGLYNVSVHLGDGSQGFYSGLSTVAVEPCR